MYKQHDFDSSYLPLSELVSIGLVIGFGGAVLEYISVIYTVLTLSWDEFSIHYLIFNLSEFVISPIYGAVSAMLAYPFYKRWAKRKNGLKMTVYLMSEEK
jgi:phosphate/sulfate permease